MKTIACRHHYFRIGLFVFLNVLAFAPLVGHAAVGQGPVTTNEVELQQRQKMLFEQAVLSEQDRLRVGRERAARQQMERSNVIQGMAARLAARKQLVELQPTSATPADAAVEEPSQWLKPVLALLLLGVIFFCAGFLKRQHDRATAG